MPNYQSSHAARERAAQSARRLEHCRWSEPPRAAISLRAWLWGIGLSLVLWALIWSALA